MSAEDDEVIAKNDCNSKCEAVEKTVLPLVCDCQSADSPVKSIGEERCKCVRNVCRDGYVCRAATDLSFDGIHVGNGNAISIKNLPYIVEEVATPKMVTPVPSPLFKAMNTYDTCQKIISADMANELALRKSRTRVSDDGCSFACEENLMVVVAPTDAAARAGYSAAKDCRESGIAGCSSCPQGKCECRIDSETLCADCICYAGCVTPCMKAANGKLKKICPLCKEIVNDDNGVVAVKSCATCKSSADAYLPICKENNFVVAVNTCPICRMSADECLPTCEKQNRISKIEPRAQDSQTLDKNHMIAINMCPKCRMNTDNCVSSCEENEKGSKVEALADARQTLNKNVVVAVYLCPLCKSNTFECLATCEEKNNNIIAEDKLQACMFCASNMSNIIYGAAPETCMGAEDMAMSPKQSKSCSDSKNIVAIKSCMRKPSNDSYLQKMHPAESKITASSVSFVHTATIGSKAPIITPQASYVSTASIGSGGKVPLTTPQVSFLPENIPIKSCKYTNISLGEACKMCSCQHSCLSVCEKAKAALKLDANIITDDRKPPERCSIECCPEENFLEETYSDASRTSPATFAPATIMGLGSGAPFPLQPPATFIPTTNIPFKSCQLCARQSGACEADCQVYMGVSQGVPCITCSCREGCIPISASVSTITTGLSSEVQAKYAPAIKVGSRSELPRIFPPTASIGVTTTMKSDSNATLTPAQTAPVLINKIRSGQVCECQVDACEGGCHMYMDSNEIAPCKTCQCQERCLSVCENAKVALKRDAEVITDVCCGKICRQEMLTPSAAALVPTYSGVPQTVSPISTLTSPPSAIVSKNIPFKSCQICSCEPDFYETQCQTNMDNYQSAPGKICCCKDPCLPVCVDAMDVLKRDAQMITDAASSQKSFISAMPSMTLVPATGIRPSFEAPLPSTGSKVTMKSSPALIKSCLLYPCKAGVCEAECQTNINAYQSQPSKTCICPDCSLPTSNNRKAALKRDAEVITDTARRMCDAECQTSMDKYQSAPLTKRSCQKPSVPISQDAMAAPKHDAEVITDCEACCLKTYQPRAQKDITTICECKKTNVEFGSKINFCANQPSKDEMKLALQIVKNQCKEKDGLIHVLKNELIKHATSNIFSKLLARTCARHEDVVEYDKLYLALQFPSSINVYETIAKVKGACGCRKDPNCAGCTVNPAPLTIVDAKRVGTDSIMMKWTPSDDGNIIGYEVCVLGVPKARVLGKNTDVTVINGINTEEEATVTVYALSTSGRCFPAAVATYKPPKSADKDEKPKSSCCSNTLCETLPKCEARCESSDKVEETEKKNIGECVAAAETQDESRSCSSFEESSEESIDTSAFKPRKTEFNVGTSDENMSCSCDTQPPTKVSSNITTVVLAEYNPKNKVILLSADETSDEITFSYSEALT